MSSTPTPQNPTEPLAGAAEQDVPAVAETMDETASPLGYGPRRRRVAPSRIGVILVAALTGSALFVSGYSLGAHVATTPGTPADQEERFGPFWDVYSLIQTDFAGSPKPSQDALVQAAIKGMMESLNDPWSYYQGPADFKSSLLSVGGQAEGIGVQVNLQPVDPQSTQSFSTIGGMCDLVVVKTIVGSPAAGADIQAGDVISSVDGARLIGLSVDQAVALIKGPQDTTVKLGLIREGTLIHVPVVRKIYSQPEIVAKTLEGNVAYIQVIGMNEAASSQFKAALKTALAAGQKAVIVDIRGNLGGYVADAVKIASEFIPSGTIVYQQDASGNTKELTAITGGLATDPSIHLVVLVDGNTASSAEILSGALQARGRAKLIGSKTYGKGVVQEWLPLPNNFGGIHLTVARWLTPDKVWIQGKGLLPDVPVDSSNARAGTDPVLDAALAQFGLPPLPAPGTSAAPGSSAVPSPSVSPNPSSAPSPTLAPSPSAS
jgi:carboxyl-terminal processing protease